MAKTRTRPWDAADYLKTEEDIVAYVDAALDDGDPALIVAVLGDVARARDPRRPGGSSRTSALCPAIDRAAGRTGP